MKFFTHATVTSSRRTRIFGALLTVILMTSVTVKSASPAPVVLGTSGSFALLAKTGISATGITAIVGDIGISPAAATAITGLGLIADPSNAFSTSSMVTGKIYAADYTSPAPANLTTAISDMETSYTNAAGRTTPDFTELYAGDITGQTLTPGLYKWGTGVLVSAGGVVISGTASDVWIFQVAQNLELANGATVTLSGGAQPANIFWQVAGQVTLGTTAAMKGIILCQTAIVMSTGATLSGRALAQTAITLDANAVTAPALISAVNNGSSIQKAVLTQTCRNQAIEFSVPSSGKATLKISNLLGKEIVTLYNGEVHAGKINHVRFTTNGLANGCYFAKLEFNGTSIMNRIPLSR